MHQLLKGVLQFQQEDFESHRELFKDLSQTQSPHTLFIGCSDSRVVPSLLTNSGPGELFEIRNIANIVPPYRSTDEYVATTAAIEYAIEVLKVKNIVICGHSNCGGCNALYFDSEKFDQIPHVERWLELAKPVLEKIKRFELKDDYQAREWMTEQLNVVLQLEHLLTYPNIAKRFEAGDLTILGWHYIIETGEVYNYDFEANKFTLIDEAKGLK